jgi:hypothetical protein
METIDPYANESEVLLLGELTIENRVDMVSIYGSIDITRDKRGLEHAQTLKYLFDSIVEVLSKEDLPEEITLPVEVAAIENPFE